MPIIWMQLLLLSLNVTGNGPYMEPVSMKTAITNIFRKIISGGAEGAIRVWNIDLSNLKKPTVRLLETMKEHKCKITAIKVLMAIYDSV